MGSVHSSAHVGGTNVKPLLLPHPRVLTAKGQLEGFRLQVRDGRPVNVFLGIPFAKPPLGPLRFAKPVEPERWHPSVLLAKKCRQRSIQMNFVHTDIAERRAGTSEDCLYLNVVAPGWANKEEGQSSSNSNCLFPVMFYIHGGGYLFDSAVKYNHKLIARNLVIHGVVVVIIQYRLGLLGFFSTGDAICPGNFGLWDQLAALKWVKSNIASFGGDPQRITLFGQSAGAASADLLALSPLSRDLFSQCILMAGSAECSWAVLGKHEVLAYCRKWALKLGFKPQEATDPTSIWDREENERMIEHLRRLPAAKFEINLIGIAGNLFENMRLPVGPIIDGQLLPRPLNELRKESPPKRAIAGVCQHEGMLFLALAMKRPNAKLLAKFEEQIGKLFMPTSETGEAKSIGNLNLKTKFITDAYGNISSNSREGGIMGSSKKNGNVNKICVKILSDFISNIGLANFCANSLANGWTIFRYEFEHFNEGNTRAMNPLMPFKGATHGTELAFVFDVNLFLLPWRRTEVDKQVLAMVTKMWTNFAKYGNPNGKATPPDGKGNDGTDMQMQQFGTNRPGTLPTQNQNQPDQSTSTCQSPLPFRWNPLDPSNLERHLCIDSDAPIMKEVGTGNEGMKKLCPLYRALIQ